MNAAFFVENARYGPFKYMKESIPKWFNDHVKFEIELNDSGK